MSSLRRLLVSVAFMAACSTPSTDTTDADVDTDETGTTEALCLTVPTTHARYDLYEATAYDNACTSDEDCFVGGCSSETCSAEPEVVTTCIAYDDPPTGDCGCVDSVCVWNEVCE